MTSEGLSVKARGYLLSVLVLLFLLSNTYAIFLSKVLPVPNNPVLAWIARDRHYCLLIPGLLPVGFLFVLVNWFGMKYFQHN